MIVLTQGTKTDLLKQLQLLISAGNQVSRPYIKIYDQDINANPEVVNPGITLATINLGLPPLIINNATATVNLDQQSVTVDNSGEPKSFTIFNRNNGIVMNGKMSQLKGDGDITTNATLTKDGKLLIKDPITIRF